MQQRITRHREERPAGWTTLEAPLALEDAILQCSGKFDILLVDCLTLWTSNLMAAEDSDGERIFARAARLCAGIAPGHHRRSCWFPTRLAAALCRKTKLAGSTATFSVE